MRTRSAIMVGAALLIGVASFIACTGDSLTSTSSGDSGVPSSDSGNEMDQTDGSAATTDSGSGKDSGTATDAGHDAAVDSGGPVALGGRLVLWLAAEDGYNADGGGTLVWKDKSGQGNDAVQPTIGAQPAQLDGSAGGFNGHAVLHFSGAQFLNVADSPSLQWAGSDFAVYVVIRHTTATPSYAMIYGKWTDVSPYPGLNFWANYPYNPNSGAAVSSYVTRIDLNNAVFSDGGYNDGTMRLVGARMNGSTQELRIGGVVVDEELDASIQDTAGFNASGLPVYIGGRPGSFQTLVGDMAEIVAVKGTLSASEVTTLEAYFKQKYGL